MQFCFQNITTTLFVDIENCTCVGENNKWGEGAECNFYNGHESDFLNGKWCYAETTTCADATSAKYKRGLYLDNGRFGPSQKSCFKDKGNKLFENLVLNI